MTHRLLAPALAAALVVAAAGTASAQTAGTGSVTTTITGTVVSGPLSMSGTGLEVPLGAGATPGALVTGVGAMALTVADLTGTDKGWQVTATYTAPASAAVTSVGAANVFPVVSGVGAASGLLGVAADKVTTASGASSLATPLTVASTTTNPGNGTTVMTARLNIQLPADATAGQAFGGQVTYTVASVR